MRIVTSRVVVEDCYNLYNECEEWAVEGECNTNTDWMSANCNFSCGCAAVLDECIDVYAECDEWALEGECITNPGWMSTNCNFSCGCTAIKSKVN